MRVAPTLGLVLALAVGGGPSPGASAEKRGDAPVDADLLLDLDLLREPDLASRRPLLDRLRLMESLRMLESLRLFEAEPRPVETRPAPKPKEAR